MALTELEVRKALPGAKVVKLSDGGGLQLWIDPKGAKRWRLAYRCPSATSPGRIFKLKLTG